MSKTCRRGIINILFKTFVLSKTNLCSNLIATLSSLNMNYFSHFAYSLKIKISNVIILIKIKVTRDSNQREK